MKAKSFFGIFLAMAVVPLVLAYLVLKLGWFTPGATAKGEFVQHDIQLQDLQTEASSDQRPLWRIIYQANSPCDQLCVEQLYGLNQTHSALGKLQKRVTAQVLTSEQIDLSSYSHLKINNTTNEKLESDYLYIVDPFGKAIMKYKGSLSRDKTIETSKHILADIKKLLKYARVG